MCKFEAMECFAIMGLWLWGSAKNSHRQNPMINWVLWVLDVFNLGFQKFMSLLPYGGHLSASQHCKYSQLLSPQTTELWNKNKNKNLGLENREIFGSISPAFRPIFSTTTLENSANLIFSCYYFEVNGASFICFEILYVVKWLHFSGFALWTQLLPNSKKAREQLLCSHRKAFWRELGAEEGKQCQRYSVFSSPPPAHPWNYAAEWEHVPIYCTSWAVLARAGLVGPHPFLCSW